MSHTSKHALKTDDIQRKQETPANECYIVQCCIVIVQPRPFGQRSSLDLEAKSGHASLVLLNGGLALLLRVVGLGEKHAVITSGLLGFADAAGLE